MEDKNKQIKDNKSIPKFDPNDADMLIGMSLSEAQKSCAASKFNLLPIKVDGMYRSNEEWEETPKTVKVTVENNRIIEVEELNTDANKKDNISNRRNTSKKN